MTLVVLANIFLAIAVDKLLEVDEVEKDITKRVEEREEQRRERVKHLDALKNPTEPSGLGRTLKKIVMLYSLSVDQEETRKRRQKQRRNKRRPGSEIKQERSPSLVTSSSTNSSSNSPTSGGTGSATEKRRSFARASLGTLPVLSSVDSSGSIERGLEYESKGPSPFGSGIYPRKVSLRNPLRKAEESIDVQLAEEESKLTSSGKRESSSTMSSDFGDLSMWKWKRDDSTVTLKSALDPAENKSSTSDLAIMTGLSLATSETASSFACRSRGSEDDFNFIRDTRDIAANASSPVLIPHATPMPVLNASLIPTTLSGTGEDASVSRLERKSSLEELTPLPMPGEGRERTERDNTRVSV